MTSILYNNLKTLITNNQLVPEEQYRITDYVTTVSKANYTSAGYKFDVVVTALTTNTLYEYATLMPNPTETYFDANALLLYNIKYNVHNIIPGCYNDWVDSTGKGCIYYMVDNKGNEAPYDFKNIKYYGHFLFNSYIDGSDTSQSVSDYNSVKEVIDDDTFNIPQVGFNDECHNVSIDINTAQVSVTECSNLQIGKSCSNCEFSEVSNVVIGNDFTNSELTFINGGEIGNNNNGIIATNQTNLIIKNNNTSVTLGGGGNGVIIDSNNNIITVGNNAKDVYINSSKTVNLGNNIEQFNISSSYDVAVADDCKLFTLNQTNHLTSTAGCECINAISNDYVTLTEAVKNVTISEGLTNVVLDGTKLVGSDAKVIVKQDEKVVVVNEQTNSEVVLAEDGTTTSNPNSYITDSPADGFIYGRKDGDWEQIDTSGGGGSTISTTWSALKALRDAGTLVPGQKYRITDYSTIILVANYGSAAHQFDIIVIALNSNTLSEYAKVCKSDNIVNEIERNYFNSSKLEAWEIKYCLDNDTNRFDWATSIGKGVIYYMKDEWNNECGYDFKNIRFLNQDDDFVFTFGGTTDDSLTGGCNGNIIKWKKITQKLYLNFNVFGIDCVGNYLDYNCSSNNFGDSSQYNTFGNGCNDNTFSNDCNSNTFGDSCYSNTFGEWCTSNTFGDFCQSNTFGDDYNDNTFGNWCRQNTFGDYCYNNTFGDNCKTNTFGNYCSSNTFGDNCETNTFGNYCRYTTFGDYCVSNTFGDNCYYNTFGNRCVLNTFGNYCESNTFGNYCESNTFGLSYFSNTFGNYCASNNFYHGTTGITKKDYVSSIVLEDYCTFNNFYSTLETGNTTYLKRIRIKGLEHATATNIQIMLSTVNTNYEWVICYDENNNVIQYCPDYVGEYEKIKTIVSTTSIALEKQYKIYKYNHSSGNITSFSFSNTLLSGLGIGEAYTFEMEIQMPSGGTSITFPSTIVPLNGTTITLEAGKKNYLAFRTFDGINFIVNYQGFI